MIKRPRLIRRNTARNVQRPHITGEFSHRQEDACLTFLTPTLLAGDRCLVDVVVHELTHCWFGNGVTYMDATHFSAQRELRNIHLARAGEEAALPCGAQPLVRHRREGPPRRAWGLRGEDPDDAHSEVPCENSTKFLPHNGCSAIGAHSYHTSSAI
ncbi:hypothetical protein PsYK624_082040 [Phanerochaete sordida]|uniref:Peptidase M1 membrane alanine aminopeptidase domain-containing protein n=1 Tax=Phanerochaete sordida TaxID=48140 RepID=A0A9P3LE13_9APHY|nr:hypothetical protein PsYK624_082040 [Phanerochaete sordida]